MPRRVKRSNWFELLDLRIDRATAAPIFRQLYSEIRRVILSNVLPAGSRLPSTRQLAVRLGVSRTSVVTAYDQLLMEGYIVGRVGSGTYVSMDLPEPIETACATGGLTATSDAPRPISAGGVRCAKFAQDNVLLDNAAVHIPGDVPFNTGRCSIDGRTLDAWRKLTCRRLSRVDPLHLGYSDPQGLLELRRAIAEYLRAARAVRCKPDQIIVVAGAQQAIDLTLKILVDPGEAVWVEDPCYPAAYAAFAVAGARVIPVPVDDHGLIISQGIATWPAARAVYVTPSHQYPLGVVMSMARRLELLAWARNVGGWIIEDDYDSEFRYAGRPLASLQGLDDSHRVIYVGTLSKVLFPGLRVGYAVVPHDLVDAFTAARLLADRNPPTLEQGVVADFINQGFFTSHIRRMRMKYREASRPDTS